MGPSSDDRSQIAFFDVETTVPTRPAQGFALLEFGAILVCPRKLSELHSYSSLIQPSDLSLISSLSVRCNGITPDAVSSAPTFRDIADIVYDILHGRIWAGHNILRFDCARIREAFAEIGRPAPEPKGTIDSLALLTQKFGRRAGDMKMASLATYFGLGKQTHRSLADVRMNLEVVKYCATVLFLESSLPDVYGDKSWVSPNVTTRSRRNSKLSLEGVNLDMQPSSSTLKSEIGPIMFPVSEITAENHELLSILTCATESSNVDVFNTAQPDAFDMSSLNNEIEENFSQSDIPMEDKPLQESPKMSSTAAVNEECNGYARFLEPDEVSVPSISASLVPFFRGSQKMALLHKDVTLQLCCTGVKVRFGISTKFVDHAGRPRLSFVVDTPPNLCRILDACDDNAQRLSKDSGSSSEWRPIVTRKNGFYNYPTMRLHIPTIVNGDSATYATEIYQKESSGLMQRLLFSSFDASELNTLFVPGTFVDAYFSLDPYDYQQSAGIRIVAKKLIIHSS